jgi:hypothetical protein
VGETKSPFHGAFSRTLRSQGEYMGKRAGVIGGGDGARGKDGGEGLSVAEKLRKV